MTSTPVGSAKTPIVTHPQQVVTIEHHLLERQAEHPGARGEFTGLLYDIALVGKLISREVTKAGLVDILGETGQVNVQGEEVQKLDDFANNCFLRILERSGRTCLMASEEIDDPIPVPDRFESGDYVVLFDPLDGSSNIDVNVSIGSIFSIYRRDDAEAGAEATLLRKGTEQIAAGYILYGSSTMLVYTAGQGVFGFTLDPGIGEFLLSHPDIRIPERGKYYSCNEGYRSSMFDSTRRFIEYLQEPDEEDDRPYSARYIGSMVADVHRTLQYGGIFMYPATQNAPAGKLRLMYEANPMAMIIEQAGGMASTGKERILEVAPNELHQRVPLYLGSKHEVKIAIEFETGIR